MKYEKDNEKILEDKIDKAIFEAEKDVANGARPIPLEEAKKRLDEKYYK